MSGYVSKGVVNSQEYFLAGVCGGIGDNGVVTSDINGVRSIVYQFLGGEDGWYPFFPPEQRSDGELFGITQRGGHNDAGTFYKIKNGVHIVPIRSRPWITLPRWSTAKTATST